jgi:hypothetical protein
MKNFARFVLLFCSWLFCIICNANEIHSAAFCYSYNPPIEELKQFQVVVVDPDSKLNPKKFDSDHSQAFAYVSIGEIHPSRRYFAKLNPKLWLWGNPYWGSMLLDHSNHKTRAFIMDYIITPIWKKGYRGFFLDGLDSYKMVPYLRRESKAQHEGILKIILAIKHKYPKSKIILNRGFDFLPKIHHFVYAVTAESVFAAWNTKYKVYDKVNFLYRQLTVGKLQQIKHKYKLPIIIIDYVSPRQVGQASLIASEIRKLGFIPWVTDWKLSMIGVGNKYRYFVTPDRIQKLKKSSILEQFYPYFYGNILKNIYLNRGHHFFIRQEIK